MRLALAAGALLLVALVGVSDDTPKKHPSGPVLLLPAEKGAFRLCLEVKASDSPSADWDAFLDGLFAHFDRDGDGALSRAEAGRLVPLPLPGGKELIVAFDTLDADRDGKGSKEELKAYCRAHGFTPVVVVVAGPSADDVRLGELFLKRLDADADGKLTTAELRRAPRALRRDDLDEDETLTLAELLSSAAKGRETASAQVKLASGGEKPATLRLDLGAKPGAKLEGQGARLTALGEGAYRVSGPDGRWWLTFRTAQALPDVRSAADFLVSQFDTALGDGKSFTRAALEEDAALSGFLDLMAFADRDGDGRLTLDEVKGYLRLVELGVRAQTWVTVHDRGRNPFGFLDRDGDGRLSCREQIQTADLLGGKQQMAGLPGQFSLSFGGVPVKSWGGVAIPAAKPSTGKTTGKAGPAWFRAMDRNGDGVVSRAEFVGPPKTFGELDADDDGVISADEASRAGDR